MGKVESWTDVDYAQAAIDMLPGTVEEIDAFMKTHGIKNRTPITIPRSLDCPLAQWVSRWTEVKTHVGFSWVTMGGESLPLPESVRDYIIYADRNV